MTPIIKAHAYGNDFLFVPEEAAPARQTADFARELCDRHRGIGADGLILYRAHGDRASMRLLNADGSASEVSGNGVRCLAAILARNAEREHYVVDTDAGPKRLTLVARENDRYMFRADMGQPTDLRAERLVVDGETVDAVILRVGNPQCVVLEPVLDTGRFARLGAKLSTHPAFPDGTNVEFAAVESPDRVRILIWERGVGPTESSGTGSCAAAVAAAQYGGASRSATVIAPGGSQLVEWLPEGILLTGWAEIVFEGQWLR